MRVGILTDFPSVAVMSGPAIHTRFLHDGLRARGHEVTLVGPDPGDHEAQPEGTQVHLFRGVPYPSHPKVKIVLPWPARQVVDFPRLDLIHGQVNSHFSHYGIWQRRMHRTALLNTHTIHLPTHSHFLLSDDLYEKPLLRDILRHNADSMERNFAQMYNEGDALIVQSRFLVDYWRERGVEVPIEVVGRPINPDIFSRAATHDPFPAHFARGSRLIVVCRHDREKNMEELLHLFAHHIAQADRGVTLTLVGDGFEHMNLRALADRLPHADRVFFAGEVHHSKLVDWYAHADVFVYTSISETFGNVINEALWCGVPVVAYDDHMGVAHQVQDGYNGFLVEHGTSRSRAEFTERVLALLYNRELYRVMAEAAGTMSRRVAHPDVVLGRFEQIYERAMRKAHDDNPMPLSTLNRRDQAKAFAKHIGTWGFWNTTLLGVAYTATRLGASRPSDQADAETRAKAGAQPHPYVGPATPDDVLARIRAVVEGAEGRAPEGRSLRRVLLSAIRP